MLSLVIEQIDQSRPYWYR